MTFIILTIIILAIVLLIRLAIKGNADIQNVQKHGGLINKYSILINLIMSRNSYYQLKEININNIEITNTGMMFKLIEIDKQLQVTWHWSSFTTGKNHKLQWHFKEFANQEDMYLKIKKGMTVQNLIDDGINKQEAEQWYKVNYENELDKRDTL